MGQGRGGPTLETPQEGSRLLGGRYELGDVIGRGGMGEVRAGHDTRLGRPVAIKLLRADMAHDPDVRRRFEHEASSAARLAHPNVVAVFDTGEADGVPFIVMELLDGETLADRVASSPLSPAEARRLAAQVLSAIGAAHDAGLVHRDVKPGNVLVAARGVWKVADFGIAKSMEEATDLTATGTMIGTAAYLAPERLEGERATPASDLYSVGVLLYEALSGRKPFEADSALALANQIRTAEPEPLEAVCPDVDPAFAAAVHRVMAKDPRERFASAAEMSAALGESTASRPVAEAADDATETEPVPLPSDGGTVAMTTGMLPEPVTRAPRARSLPRLSARAWVVCALALVALLLVAGAALAVRDRSTDDAPAGEAPQSAPTTVAPPQDGGELPAGLQDALDDLEQSVQP